MKMLESDASDVDIPVTQSDQTNISLFSRMSSRSDEVKEELEGLRKEVDDLEELEVEMELMDDDEVVMYKLDTTFLHLPCSEILELLSKSLTKLKAHTSELEEERDECDSEMQRLKKVLYAKFGTSINLEKGD